MTPPPALVVTETAQVPTEPAGVVAVTVVSSTTLTAVAATPQTLTDEAPVRPVPVKVIDVPPVALPAPGETEVRSGGWGTVHDWEPPV